MLRLTLLAAEMVEAVMEGRKAEDITLPALMKGFPVLWEFPMSGYAGRRSAKRP